jgi:hypothetical protein
MMLGGYLGGAGTFFFMITVSTPTLVAISTFRASRVSGVCVAAHASGTKVKIVWIYTSPPICLNGVFL